MNSSDAWRLRVRESAVKKLSRFPIKDRVRLERVIELLPQNPYAGDIEKMKGETLVWRRRVGNYRIFYDNTNYEQCTKIRNTLRLCAGWGRSDPQG